jgi:hypothetical protein
MHSRPANHEHRSVGRALAARTLVAIVSALVTFGLVMGVSPPPAGAFVYWASVGESRIGRSNLDATGMQTLIPGVNACAVAVDASHIYWTLGSGGVFRANLDGTDVRSVPGAGASCGVAVDGSHIYWTHWGGVGRANLDGTGADNGFIDLGNGISNGVAVDAAHVYWGNTDTGRVSRADLDGSDPVADFIQATNGVNGVAVDAVHIYWANYWAGGGGGTTVGRADLDGTNADNTFITGTWYPCGVAVDQAHVYWGSRQQANPPTTGIGRANLNGTGVNQMFVPALGTCGVAVDALIPATVTLTTAPAGQTFYGTPLDFNADVTGAGATATGSVAFTVTGENPVDVTLASAAADFSPDYYLNVGDSVAARYSGDTTYGPASVTLTPDIKPATSAVQLSASTNAPVAGHDVDVTATVQNLSTQIVPFGSISLVIDGDVLDSEPVDGAGQVTWTLTAPEAGDYLVTLRYHDDTGIPADFTDSSVSSVYHVAAATPPATGASATTPTPTATPTPTPSAPAISLKLPRGQNLRTLRTKGLAISIQCSAACGVDARLLLDRATARRLHVGAARPVTVGRAKTTMSNAATKRLNIKLTRRARAKLARVRALRLTLELRVSGNGQRETTHATLVLTRTHATLRVDKPRTMHQRVARWSSHDRPHTAVVAVRR